MISRRRCKQIATNWVIDQGVIEWQRRMESIRKRDEKDAVLYKTTPPDRKTLTSNAVEALLDGFYDPPRPKIPNWFQRLRMNDWTPSMPTKSQWPMGHGAVDD